MFKKTLFLIGILSSLTFSQGDLIYNYGLQEVIDSLLPRPLDETSLLIGQDADNGWDVVSLAGFKDSVGIGWVTPEEYKTASNSWADAINDMFADVVSDTAASIKFQDRVYTIDDTIFAQGVVGSINIDGNGATLDMGENHFILTTHPSAEGWGGVYPTDWMFDTTLAFSSATELFADDFAVGQFYVELNNHFFWVSEKGLNRNDMLVVGANHPVPSTGTDMGGFIGIIDTVRVSGSDTLLYFMKAPYMNIDVSSLVPVTVNDRYPIFYIPSNTKKLAVKNLTITEGTLEFSGFENALIGNVTTRYDYDDDATGLPQGLSGVFCNNISVISYTARNYLDNGNGNGMTLSHFDRALVDNMYSYRSHHPITVGGNHNYVLGGNELNITNSHIFGSKDQDDSHDWESGYDSHGGVWSINISDSYAEYLPSVMQLRSQNLTMTNVKALNCNVFLAVQEENVDRVTGKNIRLIDCESINGKTVVQMGGDSAFVDKLLIDNFKFVDDGTFVTGAQGFIVEASNDKFKLDTLIIRNSELYSSRNTSVTNLSGSTDRTYANLVLIENNLISGFSKIYADMKHGHVKDLIIKNNTLQSLNAIIESTTTTNTQTQNTYIVGNNIIGCTSLVTDAGTAPLGKNLHVLRNVIRGMTGYFQTATGDIVWGKVNFSHNDIWTDVGVVFNSTSATTDTDALELIVNDNDFYMTTPDALIGGVLFSINGVGGKVNEFLFTGNRLNNLNFSTDVIKIDSVTQFTIANNYFALDTVSAENYIIWQVDDSEGEIIDNTFVVSKRANAGMHCFYQNASDANAVFSGNTAYLDGHVDNNFITQAAGTIKLGKNNLILGFNTAPTSPYSFSGTVEYSDFRMTNGAPSINAYFVGDAAIDTANSDWYISTATGNNWKKTTP